MFGLNRHTMFVPGYAPALIETWYVCFIVNSVTDRNWWMDEFECLDWTDIPCTGSDLSL